MPAALRSAMVAPSAPARYLSLLQLRTGEGCHGAGPTSGLDVRRQPPAELGEGADAGLLAGEEDVVPGTVDAHVGQVAAERGGPAPDLLHVEDDVGGVDVLAELGRSRGPRARQHERGKGEIEAAMQGGLTASDGGQPPGVRRPRLDRLPGQVEVPLALVVAVQGAGVEPGDGPRDDPHRLPLRDLLDD